jgi:hypothetical protein
MQLIDSLPYDATTAPCTLIGSVDWMYSMGDFKPGCKHKTKPPTNNIGGSLAIN